MGQIWTPITPNSGSILHADSQVHVLQLLLDLLTDIYPDFEQYREQFVILSTYAVEARYPGDYYEPERQEAENAVAVAETVLILAKKQIAA